MALASRHSLPRCRRRAVETITLRTMADHHRRNRALTLVVTLLVVEGGLYALAYMGPALRSLLRIGALIAAIAFGIAIWHAARGRSGEDRRHDNRRHEIDQ